MNINEEEKEEFSLLDEKRKNQIILELQEEIKRQKDLLLNKDFNTDISNDNNIKNSDKINNNKNNLPLNSIDKSEKELNNDSETTNLFEQINDYINKKDKNDDCSNIKNPKQDILLFSFNNEEEIKINENDELPLPQPRMIEFGNNIKQENNNNIDLNINNENIENYKFNNKNLNYLNKINCKRNFLFNKEVLGDTQDKLKKGIIKKNSYNIKSELLNEKLFNKEEKIPKKTKVLNSAHIKKDIQTNKNSNEKKYIKKAKSSSKLQYNYSYKNTKSNDISHTITPNKKSKEKFEKIKREVKNKFKEDHPFRPNIKSHKKISIQNETERFERLSRPKEFEIKGRHLIKTENEKLNKENINNKNKINLNKINPKEVSNRLYKLHQQLENKKAKIQKLFEEKQMNKCSFSPNINRYSKKIMKKNNNVSFNERNDNYIKYKKENLMKIREEIKKEIIDKCIPKTNEKSKVILENQINNNFFTDYNRKENNVFNRLYENKYNRNNTNLELDKNDFNDIKPRNNYYEINDFLERQKLFENIKIEKLQTYKILNENNKIDEDLTFKPKINQKSDLIARTNPERIGEDADDRYKRLYNDAEKILEKKEQLKTFYNAQYDFTPKINKLSEIIGDNYAYRKNYLLKDYTINNNTINNSNNSNINIIKNEIDRECTFKPKIIINKKYNYIQSNYKYDDNLSQKIKEELNNKNDKMNILKTEQLNNYIKECKFIPETNKQISNLNNNPLDERFYQKGLKKYMEQMEKAKMAKKEKEEKEKKVFLTGENWSKRNSNIIFKPFKLSKNNSNKIERIREEIKNEEIKECSFKPLTNESKNKNIIKNLLK